MPDLCCPMGFRIWGGMPVKVLLVCSIHCYLYFAVDYLE